MATFPEASMANWPMNLQHLLGRVDLLSQSHQYSHHHGPMDHIKHKMMDSWDQAPAPETAFLGPQLWDKKISMKMFNNDSMCSPHAYNQRGYDSSPSPPRFQQVVEFKIKLQKMILLLFSKLTTLMYLKANLSIFLRTS